MSVTVQVSITSAILGLSLLGNFQMAFAQDKIGDNADSGRVRWTAPNTSARLINDKWALVVGLSHFRDPAINNKFGAKDAQDFATYLIHDANFAADHVHTLIDTSATRAKVLSELADSFLPRVAAPNDLVLIYISTAGMPSSLDLKGTNYLATYDTGASSLFASAIAMQDLVNVIRERVHTDYLVLIIEASYSGAATVVLPGLRGPHQSENASQIVVTSSAAGETSWASLKYKNSVFTKCLIESLHHQRDLASAIDEAKENVQQEISRDRKGISQTPVFKNTGTPWTVILSAPPAAPRPAP